MKWQVVDMVLRQLGPMGLACALVACDNAPRNPDVDDSPTYGHAVVLADEALRPMLEDQQLVFNSTYPDATVDIHYMPEAELAAAMLADSVRVVFGAFVPGGEQQDYFRTRKLVVKAEPVATDAIAVIVAPGSKLQRISTDQLRALLTGSVAAGISGTPTLFFDRKGSGVPRTLVDSLLNGQGATLARSYAVNGVQELVERVAVDTTAIGFIAFAEISDLDDAYCRALRGGVRILPVSRSGDDTAFDPNQGTLKDGNYPLRRKVIMLVTEGKSGLGTGFASFVAGHKGQRVILKQGLAPERVPARDVEIVHP